MRWKPMAGKFFGIKRYRQGKTGNRTLAFILDAAPVVVAVWSKPSVKSRYVRSEANRASKRNALIPVRIDVVEPPFGFEHIQSADLVDWLANSGGTLPSRLKFSISRKISISLAELPAPATSTLPSSSSSGETKSDYSKDSTSAPKAFGSPCAPGPPLNRCGQQWLSSLGKLGLASCAGSHLPGVTAWRCMPSAVAAVLALAAGRYLIFASEQKAVTGRDKGIALDICPTDYGGFPEDAAADLRLRRCVC